LPSPGLTAVSRHPVTLSGTGWDDTSLRLPDGAWTDRMGGGTFGGRIPAVELLAEFPVALRARQPSPIMARIS
jgi:(1->4)-alpha-D-glucan 1-alpha-D-glucosylmutase